MDNTEGNAVELHGDEEIIEVIDLNDTEPGPGGLKLFLGLFSPRLPNHNIPGRLVFGSWN